MKICAHTFKIPMMTLYRALNAFLVHLKHIQQSLVTFYDLFAGRRAVFEQEYRLKGIETDLEIEIAI